MKKKILALSLTILILPLIFVFASCKKIPIPYTQQQMYDTFAQAQRAFVNYTGNLTMTTTTTNNETTKIKKFTYNSATSQFARTTTHNNELYDWRIVDKDENVVYSLDMEKSSEYVVDAGYAFNEYIKPAITKANVNVLLTDNQTYNDFVAQITAEGNELRANYSTEGYTINSVNYSANFTHDMDKNVYTLVVTKSHNISMNSNGVKIESISNDVSTLTFDNYNILSSKLVSGEIYKETNTSTGKIITSTQFATTEEFTWSRSFEQAFMSSINTDGHDVPTEKIKQYVTVYLDGDCVVHDEYEFGTDINSIISGVSPKTNCTISNSCYTNCQLTKRYVSNSKVKSYGGDEIYLLSEPQQNFATVSTYYYVQEGNDIRLIDCDLKILSQGQEVTINTHYEGFNFNDSVLLNGEAVTGNKFVATLNKSYVIKCTRTHEYIDHSIEVYLNNQRLELVTDVNYETIISDYFNENGTTYFDGKTLKNGSYCTLEYYADENLTQKIADDAMFKEYNKIYLKITPDEKTSFTFIKTTNLDNSVTYDLVRTYENDYTIELKKYSSVKINGLDYADFKAQHEGDYYYHPTAKIYGLPARGANSVYFLDLVIASE